MPNGNESQILLCSRLSKHIFMFWKRKKAVHLENFSYSSFSFSKNQLILGDISEVDIEKKCFSGVRIPSFSWNQYCVLVVLSISEKKSSHKSFWHLYSFSWLHHVMLRNKASFFFFAKLHVWRGLWGGLCSCGDKASNSTLISSSKRKEIGTAMKYGVQDTPCISISELKEWAIKI